MHIVDVPWPVFAWVEREPGERWERFGKQPSQAAGMVPRYERMFKANLPAACVRWCAAEGKHHYRSPLPGLSLAELLILAALGNPLASTEEVWTWERLERSFVATLRRSQEELQAELLLRTLNR